MSVVPAYLNVMLSEGPQAEIAVWLGPVRGTWDEALVIPGWLPAAPSWTDISQKLAADQPLTIDHDGTGYTITARFAPEGQTTLPPYAALVVTGRVAPQWREGQSGWVWTTRTVLAWGYLTGEGEQTQDGYDQVGARIATYHGWWGKLRLPTHRFGKRNLALSASPTHHTAPIGNPNAEAPLEYLSQADCEPDNAIDGNEDTVYIADAICDPVRPVQGDTNTPRFLRLGGSFTRGVAVGNRPRYVELWAGLNATPWGNFAIPGNVPFLYDRSSNVRNDAQVFSQMQSGLTYPGEAGTFSAYVIQAKAQPANPNQSQGVQWNIGVGYTDRPLTIRFRLRAFSGGSVGKAVMVSYKESDPAAETFNYFAPLGLDWPEHVVRLNTSGPYGGATIRFQNVKGELATDTWFAIRDLRISLGYSDRAWATANSSNRLFLSMDDGAGHLRTVRLAFDLTGTDDWRIPGDDSIVITDDIATLRAAMDPGDRLVLQMKNVYSDWFFAPGIGKMALRMGNVANVNAYDQPTMTTLEEILFNVVNGGVAWLESQSLARQNPLGTGQLAPEDFPRLGLSVGQYGTAYACFDLGAYDPPRLTEPMPISDGTYYATHIMTTDPDEYSYAGVGTIGTERIWWSGKDNDGALVVQTRGYGGTTVAAHALGDQVIPDGIRYSDYQNASGVKQTGWLVDTLEVRRKPNTPNIVSGALIYSNLIAPRDPSDPGGTVGKRWELHPDWKLWVRWAERYGPPLMASQRPETVVEARHIGITIDTMQRNGASPQNGKVNEFSAWKWGPSSNAGGNYQGHNSADLGAVIAHILTQHADVPLAKVSMPVSTPSITDLQIASTTIATALQDAADRGRLTIWCDPYNTVTVDGSVENPALDRWATSATLDARHVHAGAALSWAWQDECAQVILRAQTATALRQFTVTYPTVPNLTGEIVEVSGLLVASAGAAQSIAQATYRHRNARRLLRVAVHFAPWVRANMRITVDLPAMDADGRAAGGEYLVTKHKHTITMGEGGIAWVTDLELAEFTA